VSSPTSRTARAAEPVTSAQAQILANAERLFARVGFHRVTIRDITEAAGVNVAAIHYHFGSKKELLLKIFRSRARELNRERLALLKASVERHHGTAPLKEILHALFAPPVRWLHDDGEHRAAVEFILRVRVEGTPEMIALLRGDVSHLEPFLGALRKAMPGADDGRLYWYLHFCLALVHFNRPAEFERLHRLSRGVTREDGAELIIGHMVDFASTGFEAR